MIAFEIILESLKKLRYKAFTFVNSKLNLPCLFLIRRNKTQHVVLQWSFDFKDNNHMMTDVAVQTVNMTIVWTNIELLSVVNSTSLSCQSAKKEVMAN